MKTKKCCTLTPGRVCEGLRTRLRGKEETARFLAVCSRSCLPVLLWSPSCSSTGRSGTRYTASCSKSSSRILERSIAPLSVRGASIFCAFAQAEVMLDGYNHNVNHTVKYCQNSTSANVFGQIGTSKQKKRTIHK